jgi:hypothetical protein
MRSCPASDINPVPSRIKTDKSSANVTTAAATYVPRPETVSLSAVQSRSSSIIIVLEADTQCQRRNALADEVVDSEAVLG